MIYISIYIYIIHLRVCVYLFLVLYYNTIRHQVCMFCVCVSISVYRYVPKKIHLCMWILVLTVVWKNARDSEHVDMDCNQAPFTAYKRARPAFQLTVWTRKCCIKGQWFRMFLCRRVWRIRGTSYTAHTRTERNSCLRSPAVLSKHMTLWMFLTCSFQMSQMPCKMRGFYLQ